MHVDKQGDSDVDDLITIGFTGFFFCKSMSHRSSFTQKVLDQIPHLQVEKMRLYWFIHSGIVFLITSGFTPSLVKS